MKEEVVLVDHKDKDVGVMDKLEAHEKGLLHRAISVFICNNKHEMLLQRRALHKYHSAGLWTNACCSHPRKNESPQDAANRRLFEEMGIRTNLLFCTTFIYRSAFDNGLTEHELDHVFVGRSNEQPKINLEEVDEFKWITLETLKKEIAQHPEQFTTWFRIAINELLDQILNVMPPVM